MNEIIEENTNLNLYLETENIERKINLERVIFPNDKVFNLILHDIINPIFGIHELSKIINVKYDPENIDSHQEVIKFNKLILNASESLLNLLENFQKLRESQPAENKKNFSLFSLLPSIISILSPIRSNKFIHIEYDFASNDIVFGNELLTSVIIRNLLTNAIKFSNYMGKITLSTKTKDSYLEFSVKDSGVGIAESNLEKIFKIGTKFSTSGTANEKGTGYGLIFCKEFVEAQGGKIWVTSELGIGSEFTFTLPLAE